MIIANTIKRPIHFTSPEVTPPSNKSCRNPNLGILAMVNFSLLDVLLRITNRFPLLRSSSKHSTAPGKASLPSKGVFVLFRWLKRYDLMYVQQHNVNERAGLTAIPIRVVDVSITNQNKLSQPQKVQYLLYHWHAYVPCNRK